MGVRPALALVLLLTACAPTAEPGSAVSAGYDVADTPNWKTSTPFVGFSLSPPTYDEAGLDVFFSRVAEGADLVAWVGAWEEIAQGGTLVYDLSLQHDYVPVVVTGFPTDANELRVVPDDSGDMVEELSSWVGSHPVPFLGFGVEVNSFLHDKAPSDFEWYVDVFPLLANAVHEASPGTSVFPVFQLEYLKGERGGVFGGERSAPEWELIDRFPDADAIGFTTYPGLIYRSPTGIPTDYYTEIGQHTDLPVVFTEVGWQAGGELGEWSGTPAGQSDFVSGSVPELAAMSEMVIWSFLFDQAAGGPAFATMGLLDADGQARPAWGTWLEIFG